MLDTLGRMPDSAFSGQPRKEECQAGLLAALGDKDEALRRLEVGQARNTLPRSGPYLTHADGFLLRAPRHDPRFERMFAARD